MGQDLPPLAPLADDTLLDQVAADLRASLAQALGSLLHSAEAVDQALEEGACLLEGGTLAWRLNPDTLTVELFCDLGLPREDQAQAAWRFALETNLRRPCPGVYLGLHPQSGRLVATSAPPAVLLLDPEACREALESLARQTRQLREASGLREATGLREASDLGEARARA